MSRARGHGAEGLPHSPAPGCRSRLGYEDGLALGAQLLLQLEVCEAGREHEPHSLDPRERSPGQPQHDIVGQFLRAARVAGDEVERGFTELLSDYVSCCCQGCIRDAATYEAWLSGRRRLDGSVAR
jgi:hypothetical protein